MNNIIFNVESSNHNPLSDGALITTVLNGRYIERIEYFFGVISEEHKHYAKFMFNRTYACCIIWRGDNAESYRNWIHPQTLGIIGNNDTPEFFTRLFVEKHNDLMIPISFETAKERASLKCDDD